MTAIAAETLGLSERKALLTDLRAIMQTSAPMTRNEARYLVDTYYQLQEFRIKATAQQRAQVDSAEPVATLAFFGQQFQALEDALKKALLGYASNDPVGRWAMEVIGIGPVLAAGLLAHLDISKAPTVGHFWSFAGLNPTVKWGKGQKRPWNNALKVLCWKIGESFVKVSGNEDSLYGRKYRERKAYELERNERGENAARAAEILTERNIGKDTDAYKAYAVGKLPPAHIHARAKRFAVKLFISHLHEEMFREAHDGAKPPNPYPIDHLGHAHYVEPEVAFTK